MNDSTMQVSQDEPSFSVFFSPTISAARVDQFGGDLEQRPFSAALQRQKLSSGNDELSVSGKGLDSKPSQISERKRAAFDRKRLKHIRFYLGMVLLINTIFQIKVAFEESSIRQKIVFGLYWVMTIAALSLLLLSHQKDNQSFSYYALIIMTIRNVLPLHDLDGVNLPREEGNTQMLIIFQILGTFVSIFFITLYFRKSSFFFAVLIILICLSGVVRSLYTQEELERVDSILMIIVLIPLFLFFYLIFFRAQVDAYTDFFQEIVHCAELNLELETILNNLEEAIILFSRGETVKIDFVNQLCYLMFRDSAMKFSSDEPLEQMLLENLSAKVFREYRQEEGSEAQANEGKQKSSSEELSFADVLLTDQHQVSSRVFRIIGATQCENQNTRLIRYVQIKSKSYVIEGQTKTAVQIIDISKSILYDQVKAKSEFHSLMNATVSHEMRNPLNSIINQNVMLSNHIRSLAAMKQKLEAFDARLQELPQADQLLLQGEKKQIQDYLGSLSQIEEGLWKVQRIHQSSSKSLRFLVNDFLDFARIKQSKFKKDIREFNIAEAIQEIIDIQQYQADSQGIQLRLELEAFSHDPILKSDPMRLQQVLQNLVSNSLKFTTRGSVTIKAAPHFERGKWFLKVYVVDTGCGIKKEDHHKIFKLFGTFDRTNGQNTQGIGLGLVICKTIVEEFGGQISFKSRFGHGCMFSFTFELREYQSADLELSEGSSSSSNQSEKVPGSRRNISQFELKLCPQEESSSIAGGPTVFVGDENLYPKILITDDQVFNLEALDILLSSNGIKPNQIHRALNGLHALEQVRAQPKGQSYDLIFMDCNMPFMDGYEATQKIRSIYRDRQEPQPQIVAVTGHSEDAFKQRAIESGMNELISKPATNPQIARIIQAILGEVRDEDDRIISLHSCRQTPKKSFEVGDGPSLRS